MNNYFQIKKNNSLKVLRIFYVLENNTLKQTCTCRLTCSANDALVKINFTTTVPASPSKKMRKCQDGGLEHQKTSPGITHEKMWKIDAISCI